MRRLVAVIASLVLAAPAWAQVPAPYRAETAILASNFDLDGEAADDDQVVVSAQLADSTSYTILANPDVCRLIDVTITDANSSVTAGLLTVSGTDCWDRPIKATFTFAAGGSGVKTLTVIDFDSANPKIASGAYFKTVTSVVTGVLTGEEGAGVDLIKVGYTSNSVFGYPLYGRYQSTPGGRRWVDIWQSYDVRVLVTNGASTTDVKAVSTSTTDPFQNVSVGDMLIFNVNGEQIMRKVTTRTDADNVIVNAPVVIPAAGVNFKYKKFFFSTDPQDGWIPVQGLDVLDFAFVVAANADTGGVISNIECGAFITSDPPTANMGVQVDTATIATGNSGTDITSIDLRLFPHYTHCRAGIKFGTGDDADAANEDISIILGVRK